MANVDIFPQGAATPATARMTMDEPGTWRYQKIIDIPRMASQLGLAVASSDVVRFGVVPKATIITGCMATVIQASTTVTPTVDIGVTGTAALFYDDLDVSATGEKALFVTATADLTGSYLEMLCNTAVANLIIKVEVSGITFAGNEDYLPGNWGV